MIGAAELAARHRLRRVPGRSEWRGDCPACHYAAGLVLKERDGRAMWWCASCADDREALTAAVIGRSTGVEPRDPTRQRPKDDAERSRCALALWRHGVPVTGTLAARYLAARGVLDALSGFPAHPTGPALRFLPEARHMDGSTRPALLALVCCTKTAEPVAAHRTFLSAGGTAKAGDPPRASKGPVKGGAILLHAPDPARGLVVAEGAETAASASGLLGLPAWACVSAGGLAAFVPPPGLAALTIAADPDEPGQRAAWTCARRLRAVGLRVRVATPDAPGADFNDLLQQHQRAEAVPHG
jgi:putative DNA primase/helicase